MVFSQSQVHWGTVIDVTVGITPVLGTADRLYQCYQNPRLRTAEEGLNIGLSAAGDLLLIGGVLCKVAKVGNEIRILKTFAAGELALAAANAGLAGYQFTQAESNTEGAIHAANAALNLLVGYGALKMVRAKADKLPELQVPARAVPQLQKLSTIEELKEKILEEYGLRVLLGHTKKQIGPAASIAQDKVTGKISKVHFNDYKGKTPDKLSSQIASKERSAPVYERTKGAGSHAEVYAVDELLKARPGAKLCDIEVLTLEIQAPNLRWTVKPPCLHCEHLLEGVNFINNTSVSPNTNGKVLP